MSNQLPISPRITVGGLLYFARMLDKMRKHAARELRDDFIANLGQGMDARLCRFLRVDYNALRTHVLSGASDDEALAWCQTNGRTLNEEDVAVWNGFVSKRGWNDEVSTILEQHKAAVGLGARGDIRTFFEFFDVDEGRSP